MATSGELAGKRVLIVDDDVHLCQMLILIFERAGAVVYAANDGRDGLRRFFNYRPHLLLLDINLPDINGWEVCRQIRLLSQTPILMLSSARKNEDVIHGLDLGADDYLTKPFDIDVLLARSRAILRRANGSPRQVPLSVYSDGYLTIDFSSRRVFADGQPVKLNAKEFQLLSYLAQNDGHILTDGQILERVWGRADLDAAEHVHLYIDYLRKKLEPDPQRPRYLVTERGVGYRFETAVVQPAYL